MIAGLLICTIFASIVWLVFFKLKWLKFTIPWAVVSVLFGGHLLLIFLIGMRFMTPMSSTARVVQHTIQLVPRLSQPTQMTEVLVEENTLIKQGQPLFRFDRRQYEFQVAQLQAQLAEAKQNVKIYKADVQVAQQKTIKIQSELDFQKIQLKMNRDLAAQGAGSVDDAERSAAKVKEVQASLAESRLETQRAQLQYDSQINGVNTGVASLQAQLEQAQFYLDNTTMYAPEDGRIVNLQARPGMVAGIIRAGAIASFICEDDRYLLASFFQENLKYVKPGQLVEIALNLYPGQIFQGRVESIWKASSYGQYLPSGRLPHYDPELPFLPQSLYAVKIVFDQPDQQDFTIGAQGYAAIYTEHNNFAYLRKISIRAKSWLNWLYPLQ
jgi:multidrug resistance efflux pump